MVLVWGEGGGHANMGVPNVAMVANMGVVWGWGVAMPIWGFPTWPWLPICSAPSATPTFTTIDCLPRIIFLHSSVSSVG